jgi:hypothetical protein
MSKKSVAQLHAMNPEEERAYFDSHDPVMQGEEPKVSPIAPPKDTLTNYTFRISRRDLSRLITLANKRGTKTSELIRQYVRMGLEADESGSLERQVNFIGAFLLNKFGDEFKNVMGKYEVFGFTPSSSHAHLHTHTLKFRKNVKPLVSHR